MFAPLKDYVTGRSSGWFAKNSAALVTLADATTGLPYNASGGGGGGGVADTLWIDTGNSNIVFVYRDTGSGAFAPVSIPSGAAYTVVGPAVPAGGRLDSGTNIIGTVNQIGQRPWILSSTINITRPANTTTYTVGGMVLASTSGGTTLPSANLAIGSQRYTVQEVSVFSSNGAAVTRGQFALYLFDSANPAGVGLNDNAAFNPTIASLSAPNTCKIGLIPTSVPNSGTATYGSILTNVSILGRTNGSGVVFLALVASNAYVPTSGETFSINISGVY